MKAPLHPVTRALLYIPARLYAAGVRLRHSLYRHQLFKTHRLSAPVISIGNLTVGGTGKTPLTAFIARYLRDEGLSVAILSRGYKRSGTGRVEVSNGQSVLCGPQAAGDEPYLLAVACSGVRVIVDSDRYGAGRWLEQRAKVSAFILDDAFQHLRVARDLNLLLLDATEPLSELRMVPLGRLREPLTAMQRADAVIITRADQPFDRAAFHNIIRRHCGTAVPIFHATHKMTRLRQLNAAGDEHFIPVTNLAHCRVAAVSGIARPERFIADLERLNLSIALRRDFRDHHRYTAPELEEIFRQAQAARAEAVIITEKDAANLPPDAASRSPLPLYAAQIEFRCEEEAELKKLIRRVVQSPGP
ncbi:MAG TPA: tetraacyldisaccharide 4'-kinase [Blastocatellia bacterium]|nr:tetraacyldisaccharide 4'-kinase [Blastocatellia bacterium]